MTLTEIAALLRDTTVQVPARLVQALAEHADTLLLNPS